MHMQKHPEQQGKKKSDFWKDWKCKLTCPAGVKRQLGFNSWNRLKPISKTQCVTQRFPSLDKRRWSWCFMCSGTTPSTSLPKSGWITSFGNQLQLLHVASQLNKGMVSIICLDPFMIDIDFQLPFCKIAPKKGMTTSYGFLSTTVEGNPQSTPLAPSPSHRPPGEGTPRARRRCPLISTVKAVMKLRKTETFQQKSFLTFFPFANKKTLCSPDFFKDFFGKVLDQFDECQTSTKAVVGYNMTLYDTIW